MGIETITTEIKKPEKEYSPIVEQARDTIAKGRYGFNNKDTLQKKYDDLTDEEKKQLEDNPNALEDFLNMLGIGSRKKDGEIVVYTVPLDISVGDEKRFGSGFLGGVQSWFLGQIDGMLNRLGEKMMQRHDEENDDKSPNQGSSHAASSKDDNEFTNLQGLRNETSNMGDLPKNRQNELTATLFENFPDKEMQEKLELQEAAEYLKQGDISQITEVTGDNKNPPSTKSGESQGAAIRS